MITVNPFLTRPTFDELYGYVYWFADDSPGPCRDDYVCFYRNADNTNACLVGCLLTDDQVASFKNEGTWRRVAALGETYGIPSWMLEYNARETLVRLQEIHDATRTRGELTSALVANYTELRNLYEDKS